MARKGILPAIPIPLVPLPDDEREELLKLREQLRKIKKFFKEEMNE